MDNNKSRRNLIKFIPGVLLMLWTVSGNDAALAQLPPGTPPATPPPTPPPYPFGKDGELTDHHEILGNNDRQPVTPKTPRKDLKADDKDIRIQVALLAQYADELKKEVEKTDATKVLSVQMLRKTQNIEKLAHHIASLAAS